MPLKNNNNYLSDTITVGKNNSTANFDTSKYPTDWDGIVAAYEMAKVTGTKRVLVKNGTYNVNNGGTMGARLRYASNVTLEGESEGGVIIFGGRNTDWLLININPGTGRYVTDGFKMKNFTFDLNNVTAASALQFESTKNTIVQNCTFKNGAISSWFIHWGAIDSEDSNDRGENNQEIDCTFDTHQGSLEMVLVFNQDNYRTIRPTYKNKGTTSYGPVLGLWQNCQNPQVIDPRFIDCNGYNYYSITTDNAYFRNIYANNCACVLQGANVSDNTEYGPKNGFNYTKGLVIDGFTAIGGANSETAPALQIGAVQDFNVRVDYIDEYQIGILFDKGNHQNYSTPFKGNLRLGVIKNCNASNTSPAIHPGIFFNGAGDYDLTIEGGEIYDDRPTAFQKFPIVFEESHVEPTLTFTRTSGVITGVTIVSGGSGLPISRYSGFPLVLSISDPAGTGAILHAYTSTLGVITSVVIVNGGTGYTAPTLRPIAGYTYSNIRINNTKLISYDGNPSIRRGTNAIVDTTVEFTNIRGAVKGTLTRNYVDLINVNKLPLNPAGVQEGELYIDNEFIKAKTFAPTSISGLVNWVNADNVISSGGAISQMTDLSGNNNHAVQVTPANQPALVANVVGTRPVARFTSGQHFTFVNNGTFTSGVTIIAVFRPDATSSNNALYTKTDASERRPFDTYLNGSNRFEFTYANAASLTPVSTSNFNVLGASSTATPTQSHNYYLNGLPDGTAGGPAFGGGDTGILRLGIRGSGGTNFIGDIAEAMIFNRKLTDSEVLQISTYLKKKYAI